MNRKCKALIENNDLLLLADIALANNPDIDEVDLAVEDFFVQPRVLDVSQDDLVLALGTVPFSCGRSVEES